MAVALAISTNLNLNVASAIEVANGCDQQRPIGASKGASRVSSRCRVRIDLASKSGLPLANSKNFQPRADRTRCLGTVDDPQGSQFRVHCHKSETVGYCPTEPGSRLGRVAGWHDPRVVPLAAKWQPVATVLTLGAGRGIPDGFQPGMGMNPRSPANRGWGCHCDWG